MRTCSEKSKQNGENNCTKTSNRESNSCCGRGKVYVVGLGPGDKEYITPQAVKAIEESECIIGYKTYINLIEELISSKEIISSGMRKEVDRAEKAVELALDNKVVTIVSSGDPGVYGMAGITLEVADGKVDVEVIPGITSATASAASLGAPLMHDFAVISLSDLLTPWDKIAARLDLASKGDMVIVLYNPKSKGRPDNINKAREIILKNCDENTPVGIVRCAKRGQEEVTITNLKEMLNVEIDMLTTVLVGNSETIVKGNKMITPRGYNV